MTKEQVMKIMAEEINLARVEGVPTSRLLAAFNRIMNLMDQDMMDKVVKEGL